MRILSLERLNIRSYNHQKVHFPDGSILLSGDIGFGKSTILLAIEFALFGLGDINASSLLRRGEREGMVRLEFELDEKKVNAKSIMGMMSLGVLEGEEILVVADGKDEEEAIKKIEKYLSASLNETR